MGDALHGLDAFGSSVSLKILVAVGIASSCAPAAQATAPPPRPADAADGRPPAQRRPIAASTSCACRSGRHAAAGRSAVPATQQTPAIPPRPSEPAQPQGRLLKLQVKLGSQPNDAQKGWLGVEMEPLELPLALSLGLPNGDGAFLLNAVAGGPAAQAGIRFGDIVVGLNGRAVANMNDLRQRVSAMTPGSEVQVEVWRVAADDGDFLQMLRRLADGGNTHVMYRLGRMYAAGNGVARDEIEAVRWYRKACGRRQPERHRGARRSRCSRDAARGSTSRRACAC